MILLHVSPPDPVIHFLQFKIINLRELLKLPQRCFRWKGLNWPSQSEWWLWIVYFSVLD